MKLVYRPLFLADVSECADYLASEAYETVAETWHPSVKKALQNIRKKPGNRAFAPGLAGARDS